jgi:hypothetical protein
MLAGELALLPTDTVYGSSRGRAPTPARGCG